MKSIVVDLLGGDSNVDEILIGLKKAKEEMSYHFVLAGPKEKILSYFAEDEITILDCTEDVTNTTNPMGILHDLDHTALVQCYNYLNSHEDAVGLLTVASTGCVLVGSIFKLGLVKGVKAPVLATELLDKNGNYFLLADCGANVDASPSQLLEFAKLGSSYMKCYTDTPRVGLANIGSEPGKGNKQMKEAYKILEASNLNFIGNVEFTEVFSNLCDVLVADGAIGNCILKNTEGVATLLKNTFKDYPSVASHIYKNFVYNDNGAAILLGPKKIILKAHGAANSNTILSSLALLERLDKRNLVSNMEKEFSIC